MRDSQDASYHHSSGRHASSVHHQRESDRYYDPAQTRPSGQIGSPGSARRRSLLLNSPQAAISQSPSGSRPLRIQPEGSSYHHRSYSRHDENRDAELTSAFGRFGLTEQDEVYNHQGHPFNSGEVDECDKYNPLVLHHARRQSIIQPHALSSWNNGHTSPRMPDDHRHDQGAHHLSEPPQRKQGLRYHQGSWQMTGKSGAVIPKGTTSPASTTTSKTSAHAIISPSSSRSSSSSTVISPLSPRFSRDGRGFHESQYGEAHESQQGSSTNGRKSFPAESSSTHPDSASRRRSCTVASTPTLLNSIFQRVRSPQDCLPLGMRSPLSLTDDDLKTFGMSDSQLVKHQTKQDWDHRRADRPTSMASIPLSHPSTSSLGTGDSAPNGYRDGRRGSHGTEEGYQGRENFRGRFIRQVTFSLDESHKSGRQAILVLRQLTNGLTSTVQKPATSPVHPSRASPPNIPIPRISHRFPEHSIPTTVIVNGRPQTVLIQKIIPSVVIDWSDGVRDQFDPTGMSLQEILDRCHFHSST
ncbi:hypothetical protein PTTG_07307 [Puccinia triticina 1-1 BBBD Race 1]|uniref:Uncharacterized protein n=2 Tax=Puccinia triticina TaxID=208348 RepID=A0A180GYP7_PUCT1|nr:uncharacterized protein PtA15_15A376 [Puccinia triticina]OAV97860.1 hypothetical protein PTTG_07307 [Puccinia triticina 1-1 BBBD Race 1]WAQ91983.1 hypothetical protein PtA15_15A376 [Puccinia triticina]WAR62787.1 hypothetical protein PtB15_15B375 [Puccinia triticina]